MKITKILPAQSTPAKAILSRAKHVALTSAERRELPASVTVDGAAVETDVKDLRPLEVGEVLLDEAGHFYVVEAAPETVLIIKGDEEFAAEAAVALLNRGIAVAQIENGFAIAKDEELQQLLTEAGLEFEAPFESLHSAAISLWLRRRQGLPGGDLRGRPREMIARRLICSGITSPKAAGAFP